MASLSFPLCLAVTFLERIRPNQLAFFITDFTERPSDFAIVSALTFPSANIFNRCTSASVHCGNLARVISPRLQPEFSEPKLRFARVAPVVFLQRLFSGAAALSFYQPEMAPQFDAVLVDLVARVAALEWCEVLGKDDGLAEFSILTTDLRRRR